MAVEELSGREYCCSVSKNITLSIDSNFAVIIYLKKNNNNNVIRIIIFKIIIIFYSPIQIIANKSLFIIFIENILL